MPSAPLVFRTITTVFPSCRLFREDEPPKKASITEPLTSDFSNMVLFCRKSPGPFHFRKPVKEDFLGSEARRFLLMPRFEVNLDGFKPKENGTNEVLRKGNTKALERWQASAAVGHWEVMRTVLPARVWENW